jgi:hypothetical protein
MKYFQRVLNLGYSTVPQTGGIADSSIMDLLSGISLFHVLCRVPMRRGYSGERDHLLDYVEVPTHLVSATSINLAPLATIILEAVRIISDHFHCITRGCINVLQDTCQQSPLLKSFAAAEAESALISGDEGNLVLEKLSARAGDLVTENLNDLENSKRFVQSTKVYRVFFSKYLASLVQHWCLYSTYCLKASLPELALLVSTQELQTSVSGIIEDRGEIKRLLAVSIWR